MNVRNTTLAEKYLCRGVRKPRFRSPNTWDIQNWMIYAILRAENIEPSIFAEEMGVSSRTVAAWIYEGRIPSENNQVKIERGLKVSKHILFDSLPLPPLKVIKTKQIRPKINNYFKRAIKNRVLVGLLIHYQIGLSEFARNILEASEDTVRCWIYEGTYPEDHHCKNVCDFFGLPEHLLFYECQ